MAQSPIGAWEAMSIAENGDAIKSGVIFSEGYQVSIMQPQENLFTLMAAHGH